MSKNTISRGLTGAVLVLAIGVGTVAFLRIDPSGSRGSGLPPSCDYELDKYEKITPEMVHYRQKAVIPVAMEKVRGVATGADDQILVVGDKALQVFASDGKKLKEIALEHEPYCVAVAKADHDSPGRIYVGMKDHVEIYDAEGHRQAVWKPLAKRSLLTSIALSEEDVFVADAGSLVVWHYDPAGKVVGQIGKRNLAQDISGFVCPSPYFDVAVAPDGLLRIANPGKHQVEAYTFDGHHELTWGKAGTAIGEICGCCGPSNIAILPDGSVVTAEKGIPRVKVYSAAGQFECVVAGPDILAPNLTTVIQTCDEHTRQPVDLAVDSRQRVIVLEPAAKCLHIFEHK